MCNGCERPSTVWGVDPTGAAVATEVARLLARTLVHLPRGMEPEDIDGYVTILPGVPEAIPDDIGIGLAIYVGADAGLLLATSALMPRRPQQLGVAVFLGPPEEAPATEGFMLALGRNWDVAASVIAAMVEAALLGPSGRDGLMWPEGTRTDSLEHVVSGFVAQGTQQEVFLRGRPTGWGAGRARGESAARLATQKAIGSARTAGPTSTEGMVVARAASSTRREDVCLAISSCLPKTIEWRVAVFLADSLEHDEVEVVVLGSAGTTPYAGSWPADAASVPLGHGGMT